jgi:hypothetical protein
MPSHKNPAEHCRSIGVGVGDKIRLTGIPILITYIGTDYVHGEIDGGKPYTCRSDHDITSAVKVEPKPVVTIVPGSVGIQSFIEIDGLRCFGANHVFSGSRWVTGPLADRVIAAMAEAGKAAIEGETAEAPRNDTFKRLMDFLKGNPAEVKPVAGPYSVKPEHDSDYRITASGNAVGIVIRGFGSAHRAFGFDAIDEINRRHAHEIAAELNRLHAAKTQPV